MIMIPSRVNRILSRLSKLDNDMSAPASKPPPPITPTEPFDDYANTGLLFGFHPDHYMKSGAEYKRVGFEKVAEEEEESGAGSLMASSSSPVSQGEMTEERAVKESALRKALMEGEWGGEDYDVGLIEEVITSAMENERKMEQEEMLLEVGEGPDMGILHPETMAETMVRYGIKAEEDLETTWKHYRSALIDLLFENDLVRQRRDLVQHLILKSSTDLCVRTFLLVLQSEATALFKFSKEVLLAYRREQAKADDFCVKQHRKLFI
jgi:hypothetical protein